MKLQARNRLGITSRGGGWLFFSVILLALFQNPSLATDIRSGISFEARPDETLVARPDSPESAVGSGSADPGEYSLEDCLDLALQSNLEVKAQKSTLKGAFHKVREQFSQVKPQLGFQNLYTVQQKVPGFGSTKLGDKELDISQVTLKQPVYSFGRLESAVKMVREQYKAEEAVFDKTLMDTIHQVIRGFLEVLKTKNRVRIASETIQVLNEHLTLVNNLLQAGVVLNTDVSTTKVKVLEAQQRLIEERNSHDLAKIALYNMLDLPEQVRPEFRDIPPIPLDASTSFDNADRQPEMRQLEHLIEAGKKWYTIEKNSNLPVVGFQWTYSTGNQFMEDFKNWSATMVFDFPLFDSGSSRARKAQAKAGLERVKYTRDSARRKFSLAIQQSARKVREMQEKFALARQIEEAARENYSHLSDQFREGAVINTDVLSGNLALTNARLGVNNAYYDYVAYLADHFRSRGDMTEFLALLKSPPATAGSTKEK